jgi:succinate dehydrogenase/fumarate reductase flavoprotein subunit
MSERADIARFRKHYASVSKAAREFNKAIMEGREDNMWVELDFSENHDENPIQWIDFTLKVDFSGVEE